MAHTESYGIQELKMQHFSLKISMPKLLLHTFDKKKQKQKKCYRFKNNNKA